MVLTDGLTCTRQSADDDQGAQSTVLAVDGLRARYTELDDDRGLQRLNVGATNMAADHGGDRPFGYIVNRWPLIERKMNRNDCLRWLERNGYPTPPKSSCIGCPFHDNQQWRDLRDKSLAEWADAVEVDKVIRDQPGFKGKQFMHRSLKPLSEVDLTTAEDRGQGNLFLNECEGMCGV